MSPFFETPPKGGGGGSAVRAVRGQTVYMGLTWGPKTKKKPNGIFGISVSIGSEKWSFAPFSMKIDCQYLCQKKQPKSMPLTEEPPFQPPPPRPWGSYDPSPTPPFGLFSACQRALLLQGGEGG